MWTQYLVNKFNEYVPTGLTEDECWIWLGKDLSGGPNHPNIIPYGRFSIYVNGKQTRVYAHRAAWEIANRQYIPKGMIICHRCDTPLCVNPAHLFLGTHKDNTADMTKKNRQGGRFGVGEDARRKRGEEHGMAKLTQAQADEIRRLYESTIHLPRYHENKHSLGKLAKAYDVSKRTILDVVHLRKWAE